MIGSHAVPVIVDAVFKGLIDRPTAERAFAAIVDTLTQRHANRRKENWDIWDKYGYYPFLKIIFGDLWYNDGHGEIL